MSWTAEQIDAIYEKNGNILVSAAAGSGKTAVLVERIIRLITDEKNPVDIDKFLVVTFTKAAASEMKERIGRAISAAISKNPESVNLRRQAVLLNYADITTIHSFCLKIARENYNKLGIDPAFRVADATEILLLKDEVINELFEEKYSDDDAERFLYLVENYSDGTSDEKLKKLVLKIYEFTRSCHDPEKWIEKRKADYRSGKDIWTDIMIEQICVYIRGALEYSKSALETAYKTGPETYIPMLESDIEQLLEILRSADNGFESFYMQLKNMRFQALSRKKCESETKEKIKFLRDKTKKTFDTVFSKYPIRDIDEMNKITERSGYGIGLLLDLTKEFSEKFDAEKKRRRIADYSDLEHYCLNILLGENGDEHNPIKSSEAEEITKKYAYVMTDEYQDSNAVQELILSLVSNGQNRFMVGDVKQSIYSFRLADPDIFTDKYNTFSLEKGADNERIDMFRNFRSREEVLEGINFFFMQLMSRDTGGIVYDDRAMLYPGMEFPPYMGNAKAGGAVEIDVINTDIEDDSEEAELSGMKKEMEFIADRINALMYGNERMEVYDAAAGEYRGLKYGDIAVLMRKKAYGAELVEVLASKGIPATAEAATGFLETAEIMTALSFLKVIDNPRQDIPLAAVLRSQVYGLSADDILNIKLDSGKAEYWDCVVDYCENGRNERIKEKLKLFVSQLNRWRDMAVDEKINDLIWAVYTDTGFYDMVGILKNGNVKQANLEKLVKKAADYDSISFKGLFDFIRYIEKIDKNNLEIDSESGADADGVQVMTVHKSKGLEFPVVFLAGCGSKFNKTDLSGNVIIHKKLGIGSEYIDEGTRVKYNTVPRATIAEALKNDIIAEEIRILYVALTRAKEKLIISGNTAVNDKKIMRWTMFSDRKEVPLPSYEIMSSDNYLDWIMMAVSRHGDGERICEMSLIHSADNGNGLYNYPSRFEISFIDAVPEKGFLAENLVRCIKTDEERAFVKEQIAARLIWEYPYIDSVGIPGSISVSDVKRMRGIRMAYAVRKPDFYAEKKGLSYAEVGTAVHTVLEHMDFTREYDYDGIKELISECEEKNILTGEEAEAVSIKKIEMFAQSKLYQRILNADAVFKEEAFAVSVNPEEIYRNRELLDEAVILHGRIDCYFIEDGDVVIIDYKTDHFDEESEEKFHERYDIQMELYSAALEKVTGMKVKECYIYSIENGKTISVAVKKEA